VRKFFWIAMLAGLTGCGPNSATTRKYLNSSPHRSVAVLPFDLVGGQKNLTQQASDMMANKMRVLGFLIADRQKSRSAYNKVKNQSFDQADVVAGIGQSLGVQAVLVGAQDDAFQNVNKQAAQYQMVTNPIPACCSRYPNPCPSHQVYDPVVQAYVDSCGPTHSKIQTSPGYSNSTVGFSARLRLIDVATKNVLWETSDQEQPANVGVSTAMDNTTDAVVAKLVDAYMKQGL